MLTVQYVLGNLILGDLLPLVSHDANQNVLYCKNSPLCSEDIGLDKAVGTENKRILLCLASRMILFKIDTFKEVTCADDLEQCSTSVTLNIKQNSFYFKGHCFESDTLERFNI